ncbi:MAG: hypothetical protein V4616_09555 [Bacteroidota bacterium]
MKSLILSFLTFSVLVLNPACRKEAAYQVPYAAVNLEININNPQYVNLGHTGGWVYSNGGLKGLILYRKDQGTINAYDRQSPFDIEAGCRMSVDSTEIYAEDTCSKSKFLLIDGSASSGPASRGMIQYQTTFDGTILRVNN